MRPIFNSHQPLFQVPHIKDDFEDIGAALTQGTTITLTGRNILGITSNGNTIYALDFTSNVYTIRTYTYNPTANTLTETASVTVPIANIPFPQSTGYSNPELRALAYHNNKFYTIFVYYSSFSRRNGYSIVVLNLDGTYDSTFTGYGTVSNNNQLAYDLDVDHSYIYITNQANNRIRISSLFDRYLFFSDRSGPGSATYGIAVNNSRIYTNTSCSFIGAYDKAFNRITADETTLTGFSNVFRMTIANNRLLAAQSSSVYVFTGIADLYSAEFTSLDYNYRTRALSASIVFSEDPGTNLSASDIEVRRSIGGGRYAHDSRFDAFITISGTGTTRNVIAATPRSISQSQFRLTLKQNSIASGKPPSDSLTLNDRTVYRYFLPATPVSPNTISIEDPGEWSVVNLSRAETADKFYRIETNATSFRARRYTSTGTYDNHQINFGNIPLSSSSIAGVHYYNGKFYVLNYRSGATIYRYSATGTREATLTSGASGDIFRLRSFAIAQNHTDSTKTSIIGSLDTSSRDIIEFDLADLSTPLRRYSNWDDISSSPTVSFIDDHGIFITDTIDSTPVLLGLTRDFQRASYLDRAVDATFPYGTIVSGNVYVNSNFQGFRTTIYIYDVPFEFATWNQLSYNSTNRTISGEIHISEDPGATFAISDFEIQNQTNGAWSAASGFTITSTGTGRTRTITATSATAISASVYRLVLKEDAFGTDKPETNIASSGIGVANSAVMVSGLPFILRGMTATDNQLYVLGVSPSNIVPFTYNPSANTYTAGTTINLSTSTIPGRDLVILGLSFYNNKFYAVLRSTRNSRYDWHLARFSISGTYESSIITIEQQVSQSGTDYGYVAVNGNDIFIGTSSGQIRRYSFSNNTLQNTISTSLRSLDDLAINNNRLYVSGRDRNSNYRINVFDTSGNRIESEDLSVTAPYLGASNNYLFLNTGNTLTAYPLEQEQPYTATWGTPTIASGTRAISATLTLSEDPGSAFNAEADFEVQKRSGSAGSYVWTTESDSNWAITSTGTGTSRTITGTPIASVTAGNYRLLLNENAFGTGKPSADTASTDVMVAAPTPAYSATWGTPSYCSTSRAITATLTLSEDPGATFSATADFVVRGGSPEADQTGWTISATGTGTSRTITATPSASVTAGDYKIRLKEDAFGTDKPSAATDTAAQTIGAPSVTPPPGMYTATWGRPSYAASTRVLSAILTLSEDPGATFAISDFEVEVRSGSAGSYTWSTATGWTITTSGTGTTRTITATPATTVAAGTYRLVLSEDAFGTDKPPADVVTAERSVATYVAPGALDGRSTFTVTVPLPEDSLGGAMQISLKERSLYEDTNSDNVGPSNQSYLGTVFYRTVLEPDITDSEFVPDVTRIGNNDCFISFNTEVTGIANGGFKVDGPHELMDANISYVKTSATDTAPYNGDTSPFDDDYELTGDYAWDTLATLSTTKARYYRLRFVGVDPLPQGDIRVFITDQINND